MTAATVMTRNMAKQQKKQAEVVFKKEQQQGGSCDGSLASTSSSNETESLDSSSTGESRRRTTTTKAAVSTTVKKLTDMTISHDHDHHRNHEHDGEMSVASVAEDNDDVIVTDEDGEVVKTQSPPWKKTFDYISDQTFNVVGAAYLFAIGYMARQYIMTQTDIEFMDELKSSIKLMIFHRRGVPFFGMLGFMVTLRWIINNYMFPIILKNIYDGKNVKYTSYFCEWLFDAVKNTLLFGAGLYVAWGSDWFPRPTWDSYILWYPRQGGTIFDASGEIVPTKDIALEVIGHSEVAVDFVALLTLCYDTIVEYLHKKNQIRRANDDLQATTTTSFAEDFIHHTGVCFGALFLYITAKDNCNSIAIIVLLGQFNDMCEFAALTMGLCKFRFLERVVTPTLCVVWTISLLYVWPAALAPIFLESIPIEHSFDDALVLQITLYQLGSLFIATLFWAMHMFWLYKGLLFLYRYNKNIYYEERRIKMAKKNGEDVKRKSQVPMYGTTSCIATGSVLAMKDE